MAQANYIIPILTARNLKNFHRKVNRIDDADSCWEWLGCKTERGYGTIVIQGKAFRTNRIAYFSANGVDLGELNALHDCDNPSCCRPSHIYAGTGQDNVDDRQKRNRTSKGDKHYARVRPELVPRGENRCNSSLTEVEVIEIRRLHAARELSLNKIARRFKRSKGCICHVVSRRSWSHI